MRRLFLLILLAPALAWGQGEAKWDYRLGKSMEELMAVFREANLYYVDSTNPERMLKAAAKAMLSGLDPYTVYLSDDDMADFETLITGKYAGVGAMIRQKGDWVEISEPKRGTPSDKAGLKAGDRLLYINDTDLKGLGSEKVSSLLRGEPGTSFVLKYRPLADTAKTKEVTIKRETITQPSVPYFGYAADSVGYIRFDSFTEDCSKEVREAIVQLGEGGMKALILDLTSNGGGSVGEAINIASFFLPRGSEVVSLRGKIKEMDAKYTTKNAPIEPTIPLAVLMGRESASASEILAGALQDLDRAVIIGERSFGKGLVQSPRQIGSNSILKVTTAKYYTPSGRCIQALDYTHRREDGSVDSIPEVMRKVFTTKNGRIVKDGGGIDPDIYISPEFLANFTGLLLAYGYLEDFANQYAAHNTHSKEFRVTDALYDDFIEFMRHKEMRYESATAVKLEELRQWAEREKYAERLTEEFVAIERKIKEDKIKELNTFSKEIKNVLENEIIRRWYYEWGAIEHSLGQNKEVKRAVEILEDKAEYEKLLGR